MNKAFLFDLDGVLIDDEQIWEDKKQALYADIFNEHIRKQLGPTVGINMDSMYEKAVTAGSNISKQAFSENFHKLADDIYKNAPLAAGIDKLASELKRLGYHMGVVSASPMSWVTTATKRLSFANEIELVISLHERPDLDHKPAPDGYIEAIQILKADPKTTIILEDSNSGIKSAKESGAYTIGLRQNLLQGYKQEGADDYADTMEDVINIVRDHSNRLNSFQE